jgi:hypothetical protein
MKYGHAIHKKNHLMINYLSHTTNKVGGDLRARQFGGVRAAGHVHHVGGQHGEVAVRRATLLVNAIYQDLNLQKKGQC